MTFIDKYICLKCNVPLGSWKPAYAHAPFGPCWEATCECGQTSAISHDDAPSFKALMINLYQKDPDIQWAIMITQHETLNHARRYKILVAAHCFSGSNPFNNFTWSYRNFNWQIKLKGLPKCICNVESNQELNDQLNLLFTFS